MRELVPFLVSTVRKSAESENLQKGDNGKQKYRGRTMKKVDARECSVVKRKCHATHKRTLTLQQAGERVRLAAKTPTEY